MSPRIILILVGAILTFIVGFLLGQNSDFTFPSFTLPSTKFHTFLTDLGSSYGYKGKLNKIVKKDLRYIDSSLYLDYTGSGLYRISQLKNIFSRLKSTLFANPHSLSPASSRTTDLVEEARDLVLKFLNTNSTEYSVVFTASASASLRLLAESFPWTNNSMYLYLKENHNSVLGIRRWATHWGAKFKAIDANELEGEAKTKTKTEEIPPHLFAYPPEENFAGKKYPLDWVMKMKSTNFGKRFAPIGKWYVLLDAAAYLPTNKLDLGEVPADFVVMSFYKIFGYPNLGALIIKNDVLADLRRIGFAGGSVVVATCGKDFHILQPRGCAKFEDGTVPFLSIVALHDSFKAFNEIGIENISKHVWCVTRELFIRLNRIRHSNGRPAIVIYGKHYDNDPKVQGGIITVNFLTTNGSYVGYNEVMTAAAKENINIRVGCFCNPGSCSLASGLNDDQIEHYYSKKTSCSDSIDIIDGIPLGAVRISLGPFTTMEDIERFVAFVKKYFEK